MVKTKILAAFLGATLCSLVLGACGQSFEQITIENTNSSFCMPSGYSDGPYGQGHQYQGKKGDATFKVFVYPRTKQAEDQSQGISDEAKVSAFAKEIMGKVKKGLSSKGYAGQCRYDGIVPNPNGYTVQYTVAVDERTIYNRFYITPNLMFYAEAGCDDPKNPDVQEFYELLKP